MGRRSLALASLVVLLASVVVWVALRGGAEPDLSAAGPGASSDVAGSAPAAPADLAVPVAARSEPPLAAPAAPADGGATRAVADPARRFRAATWVEGRVELPPDTPRDERAVVVAQGRKLDGEGEHRFEVGADGRFRAAFAPETKKGWLRVEGRYLFLPEPLKLEPASPPDPLVLQPVVGGAARVRLVPTPLAEPRRAELANATIAAWGWRGGGSSLRCTGEPDGEGAWELRGLDPGAQWHGQVRLAGFAPADVEITTVKPGEVADVEVTLGLAARLAGTVVDEDGQPVDGAGILVLQQSGNSSTSMDSGATKDGGRFDLTNLQYQSTRLRASAPGYVDGEAGPFALEEGLERTDVVIRLARGHAVAGRVLWPDGAPAENATVQVLTAAEDDHRFGFRSNGGAQARTGADGTFAISGLSGGPYTVAARLRRSMEKGSPRVEWTASAEDVPTDAAGLELVLALGSEVRGVVVDDLGAPVGTSVRAEPAQADGRRAVSTRSDRDDGRFELPSVADGTWTVQAGAQDALRSSVEHLELPRDAGRSLRLVLPRPATLAGRVLDPRGAPVARAEVAVTRSEEADHFRAFRDEDAATDAEGRFEIADVEPGSLAVRASAPGAAASEPLEVQALPGQRVEGLVLRLRNGGAVEGRVLDLEDRPLSGVSVSIWGRGMSMSERARTGADGAYRIEHVTPGEAWVHADLEGTPARDVESSRNVRVEEGGTARADFGGREVGSVLLTGVVRGPEPVATATVRFWRRSDEDNDRSDRNTETDAHGAYSVRLAGAGTYHVWISTEAGASCGRDVEVPAGGGRIDFDLPSGSVEGRVVDADGRPLPGIQVQIAARQEPDAASAWSTSGFARSGAEGRFTFTGLAPGAYSVSADPVERWSSDRKASPHAAGASEEFQLAAGEHRTGVVVRLARGAELTGTVVTSAGLPAVGAQVSCIGVGNAEQTETADAAGRFHFGGLSAGSVAVIARSGSAEVSPAVQAQVRATETTEVRLELVAGGRLSVHVQDAQGAALTGNRAALFVEVRDAGGTTWPCRDWDEVMRSGVQRFDPLPPGEYVVRAHFEPKAVEQTVRVRSGEAAEVSLRQPE